MYSRQRCHTRNTASSGTLVLHGAMEQASDQGGWDVSGRDKLRIAPLTVAKPEGIE